MTRYLLTSTSKNFTSHIVEHTSMFTMGQTISMYAKDKPYLIKDMVILKDYGVWRKLTHIPKYISLLDNVAYEVYSELRDISSDNKGKGLYHTPSIYDIKSGMYAYLATYPSRKDHFHVFMWNFSIEHRQSMISSFKEIEGSKFYSQGGFLIADKKEAMRIKLEDSSNISILVDLSKV